MVKLFRQKEKHSDSSVHCWPPGAMPRGKKSTMLQKTVCVSTRSQFIWVNCVNLLITANEVQLFIKIQHMTLTQAA